jgi:Flp pilus assembly protein TadG
MMRYHLKEKGQELVEYALVLPILLVLVFGIIDFAWTIFAYNSIANAAREGARRGVVPSAEEQDMIDATIGRTGGVRLTDANITVTRTFTQSQVAVVYDHALLSGALIQIAGGNPTLQLRSTATMRRE